MRPISRRSVPRIPAAHRAARSSTPGQDQRPPERPSSSTRLVSTHAVLKGTQRETDLNSVTGKIVLVHSDFTERDDLRTGFTTYTGQVFMGVGPGHTQFIHDTGLLVFDADANIIKLAGKHTVLFGGNEAYCQALA